jgi:hypothetical protein
VEDVDGIQKFMDFVKPEGSWVKANILAGAGRKKFADTFLDEDSPMQFAAEKTPAINPYGGLKDNQYRGSIG